ncbi:MAG: hypothetical protein GF355_10410, partial [Candidatus Eisenbacteria bacterium]|nr:hypothetical protein [Candidatus Eisenbacteria bacterium]
MTARRKKTSPAQEGPAVPWDGPIWNHIHFQEEPLEILRRGLAAGRLPHALLFWGPAGTGKLRTAQGLAQALLCTEPERPCGACRGCRKAARLIHPDLHLLRPLRAREDPDDDPLIGAYAADRFVSLETAPPATVGIDRVRRIKLESSKSLVEGRCRVLLIPQADLMSQEAANAALKLLEEPRGDTFLILTVVDPRRLLPTIVSRCRRVRFRALPRSFVEEVLAREAGLKAEAARLAGALAAGSLPQALELAREDMTQRLDQILELMAPAGRDVRRLLERAEAWGRKWDLGTVRVFAGLLGLWQQDL